MTDHISGHHPSDLLILPDLTTPPPASEIDERYFETYHIQDSDLRDLLDNVVLLAGSSLVEPEVFDHLRVVTFDSEFFYIVTRGEHQSTDRFPVEEMSDYARAGFRVYKIGHSGGIGRKKHDYRGARVYLVADEIEKTAVAAKKFPNDDKAFRPEVDQPDMVLDVVCISPRGPFDRIHRGRFNYASDCVFHEVGHIELRRLLAWQIGEGRLSAFPSEKQRHKFRSILGEDALNSAIFEISTDMVIQEMYAMMIDREAARRLLPSYCDHSQRYLEGAREWFRERERGRDAELSKYVAATLLVSILEERFPEYKQRKEFVRGVLRRGR